MLFNCARGSVSSWVRWSKVRFPQYWAGDPPLPPVPAPCLVSSWRGHLCFRLGRGGPGGHASRDLVRFADSLHCEFVVSLVCALDNTGLPHHRQGLADCLDSFSDFLADIL